MELARIEQREFTAMRAHIEQLLNNGWSITSRSPLTIERQGQRSVVRCGVLISSQ